MSGPPEPTRTPVQERNLIQAVKQQLQYLKYLDGAEKAFDERYRRNECPSEKIDNFHISAYLSKGSYGKVYKVEHIRDRKIYALKVLQKTFVPKGAAAALREKRITYALQSEFIIKLFFTCKDSKNLYLIMEHAEYGDLWQFVGRGPGERLTKIFAAQITLAIEYLHRCNIVHRDLKCKNILIGSDFYLKVADLGLADKLRGTNFRSVGTPHCMAPEMFKNFGYGKGVDWWALGIIIYELLFGRDPFAAYDLDRCQVGDAVQQVRLSFPKFGGVSRNSSVFSLLSGLLEKDCTKRLGALKEGAEEVKLHPWFGEIIFLDIINKVPMEPVVPPAESIPVDEISFLPSQDDYDDLLCPDMYEEF